MDTLNNRRHILWVGSLSWLKNGTYFPAVSYPGIVSASAFQQAIIEGLENVGYTVRLLTDADMFDGVRTEWWHNEQSILPDIRVAGSKNKFFRLPVKAEKLCEEIKQSHLAADSHVVIAYEIHIPYLLAIRKIKKSNPKVQSILICPDLTTYMDIDVDKKPVKKLLKAIETHMMHRLLAYIDGYVFFTKQMALCFDGKSKRPYTVVEGVFNGEKYDFAEGPKPAVPFIMHAGSLHSKMGIEELIEAFENCKEMNMELLLFGSGEMDEYIRKAAKKDLRIKHMGFVEPQALFEYEKAASLLVNVRSPQEAYTKYSFPSKTFEYMASGTPLLTTDMQGIPEEYKKHLFVIKNNSVKEIETAIKNILTMPAAELKKRGLAAREFVIREKSPEKQSEKIVQLLKKGN